MRKSWTISLIATTLFPLSGCLLPPAVTIASWSADIVTYEVTGKTATDHVYSAVARSDCSFVRILHDEPICVDPPPGAGTGEAVETPPATEIDKKPPPDVAAASPAQSKKLRVTIGSFLNRANAESAVARYADWHPVITKVTVGTRHFHRVVANSLSSEEAAALKAKMAADQPSTLSVARSE